MAVVDLKWPSICRKHAQKYEEEFFEDMQLLGMREVSSATSALKISME